MTRELNIWLDGDLRMPKSPLSPNDRYIQGFIHGMCSDELWHIVVQTSIPTVREVET